MVPREALGTFPSGLTQPGDLFRIVAKVPQRERERNWVAWWDKN
jgi:hypothetical protein